MLNMGARTVALGIAVLSLCGCSPDQPTAPSATTPPVAATPTAPTTSIKPPLTPIQGRVVDFQSIRPIAGATVSIGDFGTAVTDSDGRYSIPQPPLNYAPNSPVSFTVNGEVVGRGYPRGENNRAGDVAVDRGNCVMRYGMVLDSTTMLPIVGANVATAGGTKSKPTDKDGWYELDFHGCGYGYTGFNTTWATASAPGYTSAIFDGGRGWSGVRRNDVMLTPIKPTP
jgi:hypothetical protein